MNFTQKNNLKTPLLDFIPAELKENKVWEIVYYVLNPYSDKLERKRIRVKPLNSITERRKLAKRMVLEVNKRLLSGWNPFLEQPKSKEFTKLNDVINIYLNHLKIELRDENLRYDTYRTYNSRLKVFKEYLISKDLNNILCYSFDSALVGSFLDFIRYNKGLSARTRDNYMTFLRTFGMWLISKQYLTLNPCSGLKKTNKKHKSRVIIDTETRLNIFNYFKTKNKNYLTLCLVCYYCLVRRTELSKLKVSAVNLENNTIFIPAENSKNHKGARITIPVELKEQLKEHINNTDKNLFLFSDNNYAVGAKPFLPNKCTSEWSRMRKKLNLSINIKWYSLKDTGITDLITAGVPLLSVRDQARHHSIKQTDEYTPKNMRKADLYIKDSGIKF